MRLRNTTQLLLFLFLTPLLKAQVWYPEGVYTNQVPQMITVDKHLVTIAASGNDGLNSFWQVSVNDGQTWIKLPLLKLSKIAEINDIKMYLGMIYVCGNFTFDNGNYNGLVRYTSQGWQGLGQFRKIGTQLGTVLSMDVHENNLVIGGSFFTIGSDTIPYIARFNGFKFLPYFEQCKDCAPDNMVIDIASNDSTVVICGQFSRIGNQKSKYLYRINRQTKADTFINTPRLIEKLALDGTDIYGSGGLLKDKKIYKITQVFTEINFNLDSTLQINEILVWDGKLIANGEFNIASNVNRVSIIRLDNNTWKDISNNYREAHFIATGRSMLFAVGNPKLPLSIWNPNRNIVRFYPNLTLVKTKVYLDSNNNCVRDPNERLLSKQYIKLPLLNKGVFTNEHGLTEFMVPNAVQSTYRFVIKPFRNFIRSNCSDTAINKTFYPGNYSDSIQFPLVRVPDVNDIRVFLSSPRGKQVVKNKKVQYYISYENVGSNTISGNIVLKKSPLFTKEITLPLYKTKLNDSMLAWDYSNLKPGEKKVILYTAYPENAQFDQQLQFDAQVATSISSGSSAYSSDDFDSIPQEVDQDINAFRKDVYPTPALGDSITYLDPADRDLRYNISFNNFTTDTVFYAVVIDTLDLNLDMSYIEETGSNKPYFTEVQTDPNNQYKGILIWHFPNIRLSPNPGMDYENTESGSYIGFKVVTKPLSQGYYLKNIASVFYDNTFAGNTNAVYCTLAILGIDELNSENDAIKIFPNPFNGGFEIQYPLQQGDLLRMTDAAGKPVYSETVNAASSSFQLDASFLPTGIYIVQVISGDKIFSKKLIKVY